MKYRVVVIADNSGKWCGNGITFDTVDEAKKYARDLMSRWMAVRDWRVVDEQDNVMATSEEVSV